MKATTSALDNASSAAQSSPTASAATALQLALIAHEDTLSPRLDLAKQKPTAQQGTARFVKPTAPLSVLLAQLDSPFQTPLVTLSAQAENFLSMVHVRALSDHMRAQVGVWPVLIPTASSALALPVPHASKDSMLQELLAWPAQATVKPAIVSAAFIVFLLTHFQTRPALS